MPLASTRRSSTSTWTAELAWSPEVEATLAALIDAAVEPFATTPADRAVVRAMIDLNTWEALRDQELGQAEAVTAIARMLIARITTASARA